MNAANAVPARMGVDVDALAMEAASVLADRIVFRRDKYRFRVRHGIGKPLPDAVIVAIVAVNLPPMPVLTGELLARLIISSDTFKEALG